MTRVTFRHGQPEGPTLAKLPFRIGKGAREPGPGVVFVLANNAPMD
jgi:hypothetical protein